MQKESFLQGISIGRIKYFWDHHPCNIRHSSKMMGTKEYFDEVQKRKYFVEPHILPFVDFKHWLNKKVLEIGCGIGTDSINFARHGAWVSAVELSDKSLEIAKQRAKVYGLGDRIQFYCGNAEELKTFVPVEPYDLIYSFGVIHHTPHPERIIAQLHNYMHSDSMVKVMVYNRLSFKVLWIVMKYGKGRFWKTPELISRYSEAQEGCPLTYTFTRSQVQSLLERYGFEVKQMRVDHIFPYRISEYVKYRYVTKWYFRYLPKKLFYWLEHNFGWHICVTAIGNGTKV